MLIDNLAEKIKVSFQIACIDHTDNRIGKRSAGDFSKQDIGGNFFVGRICGKRICTRQIQQGKFVAVPQKNFSFFFLDGYSGIIADFLTETGQGIK